MTDRAPRSLQRPFAKSRVGSCILEGGKIGPMTVGNSSNMYMGKVWVRSSVVLHGKDPGGPSRKPRSNNPNHPATLVGPGNSRSCRCYHLSTTPSPQRTSRRPPVCINGRQFQSSVLLSVEPTIVEYCSQGCPQKIIHSRCHGKLIIMQAWRRRLDS